MGNKVRVPVAIAGAIVVALGGIFVLTNTGREAGAGSSQAAGPAPTTQLSLSNPDSSGTGPTPDNPYPAVPSEQVDGDLFIKARTAGRNLYIPVQYSDCIREQVWPRGEYADRVEVEIRPLPAPPPPGVTTGADGSYGCAGFVDMDGPYAVIELAEPLGDRRLVVEQVYGAPPS